VRRGRGRTVAIAGFDTAMERQREEARKSWVGSGEAATGAQWFALREELGATEFLGYETENAEGVVLAILKGGEQATAVDAGDEVAVVVNQTPFYGESGGQVGDTGVMFSGTGGEVTLRDTTKEAGDLFVHLGVVAHGALKIGDAVELRVDHERRRRLRANHSVTHLLHQALRHRLGEHVTQKGSLVAPDRLRFDFSHPRPVSHDDLVAIEAEVNDRIRDNSEVTTRLLSPDQAIKEGAMALFGEKYGDEVRVVAMGVADEEANGEQHPYSVELCGGTHVFRTGDIGLFKTIGESSVASGVRRIEALTGEAARRWLEDQAGVARGLADQFKVPVAEVPARIEALQAQARKAERELADARRQLALGGGGGAASNEPEDVAGVKFIGRVLEGVGGKDLRPIAETFRKQLPDGVIVLNGVVDGKVANTVIVTGSAQARFNAVDLARIAVAAMGGQGAGGKPDFAQGGAPDAAKAADGVAAVKAALAA
jgi:alanyl-tRNA synthetase